MAQVGTFLFLAAAVVSHVCFAEHGNVNIRKAGIDDHLRARVRLVRDPLPDPKCDRGSRSNLICCHPDCTKCGGKGCGIGRLWKFCCKGAIWRSDRYCMDVGPPCILRARASPSASSSNSLVPSASSSNSLVPSASNSPTPSTTFSSTPSLTPIPSATPSTCSTPGTTPSSDPYCRLGLRAGTACCPKACRMCGGTGCGTFGPDGEVCCSTNIKNNFPPCTEALAPCVIVTPSPAPIEDPGKWEYVTGTTGSLKPRHEACFVFVNGKGYLIGGRGKYDPVDVFDPEANSWTQRAGYGEKIHHMQCVAYDGKVWIPSSWTGDYPHEVNNDKIIIYDTVNDKWSTLPGLPADRLRGGAASVLYKETIYVVGGNSGGHGEHATAYGWMDAYNISSKEWRILPDDLPEARDHVGGAMVDGRLCIAGGRNSGVSGFFNAVVESVYCYDFENTMWMRGDDLKQPRAGAGTGTTCDGKLMIVGGETSRTLAWERVDLFDGTSWKRAPDLNRGRHGSGLGITDCECGKIFIASGSGESGGRPELESAEVYTPGGGVESCNVF